MWTAAVTTYQQVKRAGDSLIGAPSQCFVQRKAGIGARDPNPGKQLQYMGNLAMKLNSKLGGINQVVIDQLPRAWKLSDSYMLLGQPPFTKHSVIQPNGSWFRCACLFPLLLMEKGFCVMIQYSWAHRLHMSFLLYYTMWLVRHMSGFDIKSP